MLIDTHTHLNFAAFKDDADEVVRQSLDNDVWLINVGSQYSTSKRAVEMAERYEKGVYAAVGLHPIHTETEQNFNTSKYRSFCDSKKMVAIGEIGLDYKPEYSSFKEKQKEVFLQQLELAKELNLPVIFHCRLAHDDLLEILRGEKGLRGVVHCFTGNWRQAQEYLAMGFYLGFNGIIFKMDLDDIIRKTPLERILVETDCPYLTPPQGKGRNEPIFVKHIAQKIAEIKKLTSEEVARQTTINARNLFHI